MNIVCVSNCQKKQSDQQSPPEQSYMERVWPCVRMCVHVYVCARVCVCKPCSSLWFRGGFRRDIVVLKANLWFAGLDSGDKLGRGGRFQNLNPQNIYQKPKHTTMKNKRGNELQREPPPLPQPSLVPWRPQWRREPAVAEHTAATIFIYASETLDAELGGRGQKACRQPAHCNTTALCKGEPSQLKEGW